jgi:glycosyltransferase involved in cell wall biosynthesis
MEGKTLPRLELVPLGVNLDLFRPRDNSWKPAIDGIDPQRPVVLYVGRLSREKELELLYQAHEKLQRDCQSQLLIAGEGPLARQARRFAASTRGVVYIGMCAYGERLARLYRCADVLAVPGRNETFSLIVLEAFASGIPVVAADQGGPAELLRPGIGGLAKPGDAEDFARKVHAVLKARIQSSVCRHHVETSYSWERTFSRLLEVYDFLLGKEAELEPPLAMAQRV